MMHNLCNLMHYAFPQGMFVGVIGRVGAGKSTLLSAIQGELYRTGGTVYLSDQDTGFGLAGQEPWIQHATVRDNILFGHSYLIDRYESVIAACALTEDLKVSQCHMLKLPHIIFVFELNIN